MNHPSPAQKTLLAAALLRTGATIDRWSRLAALAAVVALIAIPALPLSATAALSLSLLAGMAQMYHAMRTALDEKILAAWSDRWTRDDTRVAEDLADFDAALKEQFGTTPAPRDLDARIGGARRLFKRQMLALSIQIALFVIALSLRQLVEN